MASHESDREDLLREATALVRRAEWTVPDEADLVVAGFRSNGWLSVYFGQDPAFTFDADGRLRRAFADGFLYRTQGTTLARLERRRSAESTDLVRHDLDADELDAFLAAMRSRLERFAGALEADAARAQRTVGDPASLTGEVRDTLAKILTQPTPLAPAIPGRR